MAGCNESLLEHEPGLRRTVGMCDAGYLAPSAPPAPVIVQGKPAAARGEAASDESATAAGNAVDMGLKTVGTLDLGGSSLEVTFMPTSAPLQHATGAPPADLNMP